MDLGISSTTQVQVSWGLWSRDPLGEATCAAVVSSVYSLSLSGSESSAISPPFWLCCWLAGDRRNSASCFFRGGGTRLVQHSVDEPDTVYKDRPSLGSEKFSDSQITDGWSSASVYERDKKLGGRTRIMSHDVMDEKTENNTRL